MSNTSAETPEEGTKKREPGYYWVRVEESVYPRDWFIVYWGNNHWKVDGRFDWQDGRFAEIDERRIERGLASLERENAELKKENARLKAANAVMKRLGTSDEVAETIKRYKAALERLLPPVEHRFKTGSWKSFDELSFAIKQAKSALIGH